MTEKIPISRGIYARADGKTFTFYIEPEAITDKMIAQADEAYNRMTVGEFNLLRHEMNPFELLDRLGEMVPALAKALAEPMEHA